MTAGGVDVEVEIERLKHELSVQLDRDLASELGIDPSAVAAWRRRGSVPDKYRVRAERRRDEYIGAKGILPSQFTLREAYLYALLAEFVVQLNEGSFILASPEYNEIWRGYRLADAHRYFENHIARTDDRDHLRSEFERLREEIRQADIVWLEGIGRR